MRRVVVLGLALLLPAPLAAQEADSPAVVEEERDGTGALETGVQAVEGREESSKFQEYREVPSGLFLRRLTFGVTDPDWRLSVSLEHPGLEDQRIVADWAKPGKMHVQVGYDQTPHWISSTARTLHLRSGGNLLLPDPMQQELQAIPATTVGPRLAEHLEGAFPVDLRFRRDTTFGLVDWSPRPGLITHASFSHEQRNGTRPVSLATYFGVGADVTEVAAPVDSTTWNASVGLEFGRERWNVGGSVLYSEYTNDVTAFFGGAWFEDALGIENPLRFTDASPGNVDPLAPNNPAGANFLLSQPPDNRALWAQIEGTVRLTDWLRLVAQLGVGQNRQDAFFLPFTFNSAAPTVTADPVPVPVQVLQGDLVTGTPADRYDGEVDLGTYHVRLEANPAERLDLRAFARSYDYDNKTPLYTVTDYVRADTDLEGIARAALPFAWKRDNVGIEGSYRLAASVRAELGYERETWDREFRNTDRSHEDILSAALSWSPAPWVHTRLAYRRGDRKFDHYDEHTFFGEESYPEGEPVTGAVLEEQRLFDLAARERDRFDLTARFQPGERLSVGLSAVVIADRYQETEIGRTADDTRGFAVDAAYAWGERAVLYADYGRDTLTFDLDSRYRPVVANVAVDDPLNDWFSHVDDTTDAVGVGLDLILRPDRWTLEVSGRWVDSTTRYANNFVPGGSPTGDAPPWPDVDNGLTSVEADLHYRLSARWDVALGFLRELYDQEDWARDVMKPWMADVDSGAAESVFLGWRIPDYSVSLVRLLATYRF